MSEETEKLIDITEDSKNPGDTPIPGPECLPAVKPETDDVKPWSGHRKYLWASFYGTLLAAMLSASIGYMSYVLSDGNEWLRYVMWTLLLLNGNRIIFRLISPKKPKGPSDRSNRVQTHHAKVVIFLLYILFSDTLARVLVNLGLSFFDLDKIASTHAICANQVDPLGQRRCHLWVGARLLQLAVPFSAFVASVVLRRAAIKRFGKAKVPMDPPLKVAAWKMATLEQLNEDTEPTPAPISLKLWGYSLC